MSLGLDSHLLAVGGEKGERVDNTSSAFSLRVWEDCTGTTKKEMYKNAKFLLWICVCACVCVLTHMCACTRTHSHTLCSSGGEKGK